MGASAYSIAEVNDLIRRRNARKGLQNRQNGERFEFEVLKDLKRMSIVATRSAGSHSEIDLNACFKDQMWLVSAKKNGYLTREEKEALKELRKSLSSFYIIKLAYKDKKHIIRYETIE